MSVTTETKETLDHELLLRIYETVARIRAFDDKAKALIGNAQAFFVHYPVRGHEIISAAVAAAIEPDDYMTATYRGAADEIAKGVPLREMWAEMLGKQTGTSKGRGGPMHITDPAHGLMLCTGIVGAGMPIAVGLGLASHLKGDGKVTITNFGDGATNIGAFHESLNLASVWSLPVVFVCQNNQYGEHTRYSDTAKNPSVVDRAAAYAMKGIKVDGMDPVATYRAAKEAVDHARRGDGPVLLECVTFRTLGHVLSDKNEYMDQDMLAEQIANDPVPRFRAWLIERRSGRRGGSGQDRRAGQRRGGHRLRAGRRRPARRPGDRRSRTTTEIAGPRRSRARTPSRTNGSRSATPSTRRWTRRWPPTTGCSSWARTLPTRPAAACSTSPTACRPSTARTGCATRRSPRRRSWAPASAPRSPACARCPRSCSWTSSASPSTSSPTTPPSCVTCPAAARRCR